MYLIFLALVSLGQAKTTTFISPQDGSLWDFIESQALSQGYAQQDSENVGLSATTKPLPPFFHDQLIGSVEKSFYLNPIKSLEHDPLFIDLIDQKDFDIPIVVNDDVVRWMKYMLGPGRKYYSVWLARSTKYTPMMQEKLRAAGLPEDMIYLSMIESGFKTSAYSSAAASGLWQFMPATGREMGLRVDWWVDERRDPELSTDAAIKYLSSLHKRFGHWYLVWAGYNGGPTRVARGIKNHDSRDFWNLVEKNAFPAETDNYVPKMVAAAIIGTYRERYGFDGIEYLTPLEYDFVSVEKNIGVDILASCAKISASEFSAMNPALSQSALPPSPSMHSIKIPKGNEEAFTSALAKIPPSERVTYLRHVIKKGDTLGTVAKRYNVSVTSIQKVNKIKNPNRISVGQVVMIPSSSQEMALASTSKSKKTPASKKSSSSKTKLVYHVVKGGENLNLIAKKYNISTSDLKRWNKIRNANKIYPGQKLKVYTAKTTWVSYTVKSGDSLSKIADKYNCSVSDIQSWNNLEGSKIYAGQKIKVQK